MSSNSNSTSTSTSNPNPTTAANQDSSTTATSPDQAAKAMGFKDFQAFLENYGLHLQDPDDVEDGKEVLRQMGYVVD
ncbi:hypothetical protein K491DRAFT_601435 [Lophiostoma macrostomum CBS 122681]|uniref:Uncharacterized protein n=1 Tax=Lophiostoma macrostomum CBS 122681 TaxID=1314788 RepID=A0A6A6T2Q1_9PLEO|nr:hypothetical protein K491DRAFT_601435 [Lophiostoma macrostomum CBS 122681]